MASIPLSTQATINYAHILNAGTTLVKATPGALMSVVINSTSGTANATGTLYNAANVGTTGIAAANVIGAISITGSIVTPSKIDYAVAGAPLGLNNGLVVVTTGTVDLTIGYR